ncbi:MAG TPA: phosphatase domain-containing protein [Rhodothermales bacterium]
MSSIRHDIADALDRTESFFDRLKLAYKWRFNRFLHPSIVTYRGFGTAERVWLRGRVLDDRRTKSGSHDSVLRNVATTLRRIETDEIPGATVRVRFYDAEVVLETDEDGFFDAELCPTEIDRDRNWHDAHVELLRPLSRSGEAAQADAQVLVPGKDVEFGVISDLDDTVVRSGAQNRLQMSRVVLLNNASTRSPFPGVATFYRALLEGPDRQGDNPIFYVSGSPWNLYDLFDDFLQAHDVPVGPVLLRDYGFSSDRFFFGSGQRYKKAAIDRILSAFPGLPFVLIGDSGQRDPEIYQQAVSRHPGRIRAIFIRDVTPPERDAEVRAIAQELEAMGVPTVLVRETEDAARKAAELGLVAREALRELVVSAREERQSERRESRLLERLRSYFPSFSAS